MFCPYCANETTPGLNYCKRCGGNLAPLVQATTQESRAVIVAPGAAWAAGLTTAAVVVVGLGLIMPITAELTLRGMAAGPIIAIALFVAVAVVTCAAMFLRFWSQLLGARNRASAALPAHKSQDTRDLDAARFDSLNPAHAPSITEQTTRTLEHAKRK